MKQFLVALLLTTFLHTCPSVLGQSGGYPGYPGYPGSSGSGDSEANPSSTPLTQPFPQFLALTYNGQNYTLKDYGWGGFNVPTAPWNTNTFNVTLYDGGGSANFNLPVTAHEASGYSAVPGDTDPALGTLGLSSRWTSQGYSFGGLPIPAPIKSHNAYYDQYFRKFGGMALLGPPPAALVPGDIVVVYYVRKELWTINQPLTTIHKAVFHPGFGGTILLQQQISGGSFLNITKIVDSRLYQVQ